MIYLFYGYNTNKNEKTLHEKSKEVYSGIGYPALNPIRSSALYQFKLYPEDRKHPRDVIIWTKKLLEYAIEHPEKKIFIASHSESLVLTILQRIRSENKLTEPKFTKESVRIFYKHEDSDEVTEITILDEDGDIVYWPNGFFEENYELLF